jgi:hypothetical protein
VGLIEAAEEADTNKEEEVDTTTEVGNKEVEEVGKSKDISTKIKANQ